MHQLIACQLAGLMACARPALACTATLASAAQAEADRPHPGCADPKRGRAHANGVSVRDLTGAALDADDVEAWCAAGS